MQTQQLTVIGVCFEILAAAVGTFSKQLIAFAEYRKHRPFVAIGVLFNIIVGPILDATAYAFAPQTIVAPFAGLDVLFNAVTAPCTLRFQHERLDWRHLVAAFMVAGGAGSSAFFASEAGNDDDTLTCEEFIERLASIRSILYMCVQLLGILIVMGSLWTGRCNGPAKGLALGTLAGVLMGNAFFVKGFVGFLRLSAESGDWSEFSTPVPYLVLAAACGGSLLGTFFMQRGLRDYKGVYIVTVFEGAHITAACLSGDLVMGEMEGAAWRYYCSYWLSVLVIVGGIILINTTAPRSEMEGSSLIRSFGVSGADVMEGSRPGSFICRSLGLPDPGSLYPVSAAELTDGPADGEPSSRTPSWSVAVLPM